MLWASNVECQGFNRYWYSAIEMVTWVGFKLLHFLCDFSAFEKLKFHIAVVIVLPVGKSLK